MASGTLPMFRPRRLLSPADKVIEYDAIAATHESVVGTFETWRRSLRMSVRRGRPETGGRLLRSSSFGFDPISGHCVRAMATMTVVTNRAAMSC
jgi:hypothetical protein